MTTMIFFAIIAVLCVPANVLLLRHMARPPRPDAQVPSAELLKVERRATRAEERERELQADLIDAFDEVDELRKGLDSALNEIQVLRGGLSVCGDATLTQSDLTLLLCREAHKHRASCHSYEMFTEHWKRLIGLLTEQQHALVRKAHDDGERQWAYTVEYVQGERKWALALDAAVAAKDQT